MLYTPARRTDHKEICAADDISRCIPRNDNHVLKSATLGHRACDRPIFLYRTIFHHLQSSVIPEVEPYPCSKSIGAEKPGEE